MPNVNLRAERINKGLSAKQMADKLDIDPQVLLNAERGVSIPRPESALKIAEFFGCKPTDIWPVEDEVAA